MACVLPYFHYEMGRRSFICKLRKTTASKPYSFIARKIKHFITVVHPEEYISTEE